MAIRTRRARNQAFAILVVLTIGVIQLQLVAAGTASASSACNGAFSGMPQGTLAIKAVPTTATIQPGQSITVTATWDTADWSGLDAYYNCWQLNGAELASLELEEKPPANDGTVVQTVTVPSSASDGDTICVRSRLSGQPARGNTTTQKSNKVCWTVDTTPPPKPDVKITKSSSKNNVAAGDSFTYTLKVENISATDATNVVITDKIPASLTIGTPPSGCTKAGQDVTCNVGNLASGASKSYDISVTTSNGSCPSVDNTGKVTATDDTDAGNNQDSASVNVTCAPDVKITKTASQSSLQAGDGFNWILKVENISAIDATNVVITDKIPVTLTIGTLPAGCSAVGHDVTCVIGNLASGASATRSIPVTTTTASCGYPSVDNTGKVTATNDSNPNNNEDSASVHVACAQPDVKIEKSASQANVDAGDSFNWVLKVTNTSSVGATGVTIHDTIPASLTIGTLPAGCTKAGQVVTCSIGSLGAGVSATRSIPVTTSNGSCPSVNNTGTVTADVDTDNTNNSDSASVGVNCVQPDVKIEKSATQSSVNAGDSFNWVLKVTNTTTVSATTVKITDSIPASLTIGALPAGCTAAGQDVSCDIGTLAGGASATRSIPVTTSNGSCPKVDNTGFVTAAVDVDATNNSDSASVDVACAQPDVKIEKSASQASVTTGDSFNWILKVTNTSSVGATGVTITDSIPASLTIGALPAGCTAVGQDVTCTIGNLGAGASTTRQIQVTTSDASCPSVDNTGTVTADVDTDNTNNSDSASVNVLCAPDVTIEKTASKSTMTAGDPFTYTLKVTSLGTGTANNVVVHDDIPASLVVGVMPAGCNKAGQTVTCDAGNLASGQSKTFQIPVTTTTGSCPSVDNTGTVTADNDSDNTNNSDSVSVDVVCNQPDVVVRKASGVATVNANGSVTFTLTAENQGLADATGVQVKDTFSPALTITNAGACNVAGQVVTCDLGTIAAGASKSVDITVTATAAACPSVKNSAEVTATNEPVSNAGNNVSNLVTLNVTCPNPDVSIAKSSDAPVEGVFVGDSFTYTITVSNGSTGDANNVVVHDSIPAGLTITSAPTCTIAGQDLTCSLGTVAAGASKTVTVTVTAAEGACPEVTNTATVTASNDSVASNNTSDPVTDIVNCVEPNIAIKITKENDGNNDGRYTDSEEAKRSGLDVPFRLVITNTGNETVLIDELTDTFPGDVVDLLNNHCANLDGRSLAPGESVKCLFSLKNYSPDSDAGFKVNTAAVCVEMDGDSTKTACDDNDSKVRSAEVLGRTITPPPTQTPPSGTAFTGSEGTIGFGLLAMALLLFGSGTLYAGYRRRQRFDS